MQTLLTNDDGIHAEGLSVLHRAITRLRWGKVALVAPDRERSAISHAITLHEPLRVHRPNTGWYAVTGTPTDCTYLGVQKLLPTQPDLVLSGVNHGPNLGIDVLYSGTVGAAMEGARFGIPSIAFSLAASRPTPEDWDFAEQIVIAVLLWWRQSPKLGVNQLLNVNIPPLRHVAPQYHKARATDPTTLPPFRLTVLGEVNYPGHVDERHDMRGRAYYWIGGLPPVYDEHPKSDCATIQRGEISITPIQLDLTDHASRQALAQSLQTIGHHDPLLTNDPPTQGNKGEPHDED